MHITNKWILSVLVAISLGAGLLNDRVDTFFLKFGNPILFYVASISAILFLVSFFEQLRPVKFISRIGKSSLVLLALHQWYIFGPLNFFLNKSGILISDSTIGRLGIGLSYTVISILILIPTAEYLQSHLPFVVGKKKA
jgi:fucose 4-O-acetylase-like acetyltransferase